MANEYAVLVFNLLYLQYCSYYMPSIAYVLFVLLLQGTCKC